MSSYDWPELPMETLSCLPPNCCEPLPAIPPIPPDAFADNEVEVEDPIMLNTEDLKILIINGYQIF